MTLSLRFLFVCLLAFSVPLNAYSSTIIHKYLDKLEPLFANKTILSRGEVCEILAAHEIGSKFHDIDVLTQVRYSRASDTRRLLGELDLVVLERGSSQIIGVGEVKCSRDLKRASVRANTQLGRIRDSVKKILHALAEASYRNFRWETATVAEVEVVSGYSFFHLTPSIPESTKLNFSPSINFFKVSQKASDASLQGFTELELTLPEIDELVAKLAIRLRSNGARQVRVTF